MIGGWSEGLELRAGLLVTASARLAQNPFVPQPLSTGNVAHLSRTDVSVEKLGMSSHHHHAQCRAPGGADENQLRSVQAPECVLGDFDPVLRHPSDRHSA